MNTAPLWNAYIQNIPLIWDQETAGVSTHIEGEAEVVRRAGLRHCTGRKEILVLPGASCPIPSTFGLTDN